MRKLLQPDQLQMLTCDAPALSIPEIIAQLEPEHDVAEHRKPRKECRFLKHDQSLTTRPLDRLTIRQHAALVGFCEPSDDVQQSGFAATAGPTMQTNSPSATLSERLSRA